MTIPKFTIFYSWQSHIGGYANRAYIRQKIYSYIDSKKETLNIILEEDSRGIPGSSDIPDNILKKIASCDIFICDITPVIQITNEEGKIREIPNPNVMFELGFAVRHLGWERILCVLNAEYGDVDNAPFDIAKQKILVYKRKECAKKSERSLDFTHSLNEIIDDYDNIVKRANEFDYIQHDRKIFENLMAFRSEEEFIISIQDFRSSYRFNKWDEKGWNHVRYFQQYPQNKFINSGLNEKYQALSESIEKLQSGTLGIIFSSRSPDWEIECSGKTYTPEESKRILQTQEYVKREIRYPENDKDEVIRAYYDQIDSDEMTIVNACDKVISKYEDFRSSIKKALIV